MRVRRSLACAVLPLLVAPLAQAASKPTPPKVPVVGIVDSGANAMHKAFDYRGKGSKVDQFVAWWDFTAEVKKKIVNPRQGQLWDTQVKDPYDKQGHGTGTAAMAAGRGEGQTASMAPGAKLAIAKVGDVNGPAAGDLGLAVRWLVDTAHADVINISIGGAVPTPHRLSTPEYDAITYARSKGVLVVVANGNGFVGLGLLAGDPGWASLYSASTSVLAVGAAGTSGSLVNTDPEVAAIYSVKIPKNTGDDGYKTSAGTSFGSPWVAGFALACVGAARAAHRPLSVDRLEQLIKYSALDTDMPPQFEGYGTLAKAQLTVALRHAKAGTLPPRPSPDLSGTYVESVAGGLRSAWGTT